MYAIVEIAGHQVKVAPNQIVRVPKLDAEVGSSLIFDNVRLLKLDNQILVGAPVVKGVKVVADVVGHGKSEKVIVYRYKRRKYYRRKRGHRQPYWELKISEIRF